MSAMPIVLRDLPAEQPLVVRLELGHKLLLELSPPALIRFLFHGKLQTGESSSWKLGILSYRCCRVCLLASRGGLGIRYGLGGVAGLSNVPSPQSSQFGSV